jgi:Uma2 family endonuclease
VATPFPRGFLTLEEWDALPEDDSAHYELQEGVLVVSPKPARKHQKAMTRLAAQLESQCPPGWEAIADFEVLVQAGAPTTIRAPDVVVTRTGGSESRAPADEVLLAVEIISPGSRNVDLHLKPFEYADTGIPHYWVVDLDPPAPSITVFGLGAPGDGYVESQRGITGKLVVTEPFPLTIDIARLAGADAEHRG